MSATQAALGQARKLRAGRVGPARLEGGWRYVVFSGEKPVEAIPPVKGDLASLLENYNLENLRSPDNFRVSRTRRLLKDAAERSVSKLKRDKGSDEPAAALNGAGGRERFWKRTEEMPELLDQLTSSAASPFSKHEQVPDLPGIYLFSEGPNAMYVGNTRKLRTRLRQHTSPKSNEASASFAYRLTMQAAESQGIELTGTRKQKAQNPDFAGLFQAQRERVADMDVQFIELEDPIQRTLFEVFVAEALGLEEFNDFETH